MHDAALNQFDRVQTNGVGNIVTQHGHAQTDAAQRISDLVGHLGRGLANSRQ
jgi:hypothetical protein